MKESIHPDSLIGDFTIEYHLNDINSTAKLLVENCFSDVGIVIINGLMGAGKTTLVKALVAALGIEDEVTSPTFSLVNEYKSEALTIYHLDLYRIEHKEEALEAGIEEYLYSGQWVFIEWPEVIADWISEPYYQIRIETVDAHTRKLFIETNISVNP